MTITAPHQHVNRPNLVDLIAANAEHAARNSLSLRESTRNFSAAIDPNEAEEELEVSVAAAQQGADIANAFLATMDAVPKAERAAFVDAKLAELNIEATDQNRAFFAMLFKD